jgi:hypothetical protein
MSEETFKESKGLPANEHAKKLAKTKKPKVKPSREFYTLKNGKYLKITVKENGDYSTFICREKTMKEADKKAMVAKWDKEGKWVEAHKVDEVAEKLRKEL